MMNLSKETTAELSANAKKDTGDRNNETNKSTEYKIVFKGTCEGWPWEKPTVKLPANPEDGDAYEICGEVTIPAELSFTGRPMVLYDGELMIADANGKWIGVKNWIGRITAVYDYAYQFADKEQK